MCAHARIQDFLQGVQARWQENSMDNVFFPQLILQFTEGVQCFFITEKTILFQGFRGGSHFPGGGGATFSREGVSKCLFLSPPPRGGVRAPLIPENNALISPDNNFLGSLKVFSFAPKIPKNRPASPQIPKNISHFSLKCIFLFVGLE